MGKVELIISIVFATVSGFAQVQAAVEQKKDESPSYILCKNKKTVRTIRVENDEKANHCVTFYTKDGVDKEVGRAQNANSCVRILSNIKDNLEKANWTCRELESVSISSSHEEP